MNSVFCPGSIAVVGASTDPEKEMKTGWVGRLVKFGYEGKIFPVNPKAKEILGIKAYPSISDINETLDYAILALPRHMILKAVKECIDRNVKVVHIFTAGFSETGSEESKKLQNELDRVIKTGSTRVIGPNCMGIYNPSTGITFDTRFPKEAGNICFISQTGAGARRFINLATARGLRFSKVVSYGNAIDLNVNDFLEYAISDSDTDIIFLYLEGLTEGRRFFEILSKCEKRVVILKAGLSESGSGAVASHTASLAGNKQVWDSLFIQTGIVPVYTFEEGVEQLIAFHATPALKGHKICLLGRGGGIGVVTADLCEREGLKVPELNEKTKSLLADIIASNTGSTIRNPVEIGLGNSGLEKNYIEGLKIVASDPEIDVLLTFLNPEDYLHYGLIDWEDDVYSAMVEAQQILGKPFSVVILPAVQNLETFASITKIQSRFTKAGIACFSTLQDAIKAIKKSTNYYENINAELL